MTDTQFSKACKKYRSKIEADGFKKRTIEATDEGWKQFKLVPGGNDRERFSEIMKSYFLVKNGTDDKGNI